MPWVDRDSHGWVHHPTSDADWGNLLQRYSAEPDSQLGRVLKVARDGRCRTVVEENRYVDADYRSEYTAFWAERFADTPAFARRLHFFRARIEDDSLHRIGNAAAGYLGYSVLKPVVPGRVGRTMLAPPARLRRARMVMATDHVSLFGTELEVTGAPFCEQDGEYLRCAHAAAWMCHYHAALRGLVGRQLTANLVEHSPTSVWHERPLPSPGLTPNQLQAVFGACGQPALFYGMTRLPSVEGVADPAPVLDPNGQLLHPGLWDTRIFSIVCRYLNSLFPVLVITANHAFAIVGWFREGDEIRFVACDDQWGPYESIRSPFTDRRAPWSGFMIPLPPKVYLTGETAEGRAHFFLRAWGAGPGAPREWQDLAAAVTRGEISLRTFLRSNVAYKGAIPDQRRGPDVERVLRLARMPHWVWIVEAHDRAARRAGRRSVLAEFVFDSTSNDRRPRLLAFSLPGVTNTLPPEGGTREVGQRPTTPWGSQLPPI